MKYCPPTPPSGPILGLSFADDANFRYRIVTPLRAIAGATWATYTTVTQAQLEAAHTVVINRLGGAVADVQAMLADLRTRWGVRRILLDYDDAFFAPIPVKSARPSKAAQAGVQWTLRHCDGVIVTNSDSARHYAPYTAAPISCVPNLFWPEDWDVAPIRPTQPPVVLIAGSPSHRFDWDMVVPALVALRSHMPHVALRVLGCPHPTIMRLRTEGREWTHNLGEYTDLLRGATIALCPLADTVFNRCKGNAKIAEYSLSSGCAVIGSPTQYGDILANGRGIVCDDNHASWLHAIDAYLSDDSRRYQDAHRLRDHILDTQHAGRWAGQLTAIYTQELPVWQTSSKALMDYSKQAPPMP